MALTEEQKKKAINLSQSLSDDFDEEQAYEFSEKHMDKPWYSDFKLLLDMLLDENFSLKPTTWATIAGALAYVVLPIDIIPDFIPVLGWLDDIFVLNMVKNSLSDEIERYKELTGKY